LSPLDATPTMRFAKKQRDTSKVLHLPGKIPMDTSKVLRLPRKLQLIFRKRRKSIASATQNDFRHVIKYAWMSRSATLAARNEVTPHMKPPKVHFAELWARPCGDRVNGCERLRTFANGCGRLGNVERRHPQAPDPQNETGTLATHPGTIVLRYLQCILQNHMANLRIFTDAATEHGNQKFNKRKDLRLHKHIQSSLKPKSKRTVRNHRTYKVPFIATSLSHPFP
jgi:hypothetical protein